MKCLCCGREIQEKASAQECETQWHTTCVRKFFGTSFLPELDIAEDTLTRIAAESIDKGFTVPGVQKKISLHLTTDGGNPRLTLVNYPTNYILKPQTELYDTLPEAEYLVMQMAHITGIATVPYALILTRGRNTAPAYITKRIDRILPARKNPDLTILAMEDFCKLEQRLTEDKYQRSYEQCAKVVTRFSAQLGLDLSELFLRMVFSFVVGNSDMHLKNFSLIETKAASQTFVLSEAYDMLPVNVIILEDVEQLALTVNGKKHNIRKNDFLKFAEISGIPFEAAAKMIQSVISRKDRYLHLCEESYLPDYQKKCFRALIEERTAALC